MVTIGLVIPFVAETVWPNGSVISRTNGRTEEVSYEGRDRGRFTHRDK
jgi:hypothetical protein